MYESAGTLSRCSGALAARPLTINFVCTGNICRSPTAEVVTRTLLTRAGLHSWVSVESSGTHGHDGWSADSRSVAIANQRGYDLRAHKARTFDASDFGRCDALLALDASHMEWLLKRAPPDEKGKVALCMVTAADARRRGEDVADPYYEDTVYFERVVDQCEAAAEGLVAALSAAAPAGAEPAARRAALGAALSRLLRGGVGAA
jgi:protein-tyrosine phosphatase